MTSTYEGKIIESLAGRQKLFDGITEAAEMRAEGMDAAAKPASEL